MDPLTRFTFRAGRQEMPFGSERWIGIAYFSNVRKHFDGYRAFLVSKDNDREAFLTRGPHRRLRLRRDQQLSDLRQRLRHPCLPEPNPRRQFQTGFTWSRTIPRTRPTALVGRKDTRSAPGSRRPKPFDLDYQWERFNGQNSAPTPSPSTRVTPSPPSRSPPRFFLGFDIASGDRPQAGVNRRSINSSPVVTTTSATSTPSAAKHRRPPPVRGDEAGARGAVRGADRRSGRVPPVLAAE